MGPGGHLDPEISEEGPGILGGGGGVGVDCWSLKKFFWPFRASVWSKNKGGWAPGPLP